MYFIQETCSLRMRYCLRTEKLRNPWRLAERLGMRKKVAQEGDNVLSEDGVDVLEI